MTYRELYNKLVDFTDDFSKSDGIFKVSNKNDLELAEDILNKSYSNVKRLEIGYDSNDVDGRDYRISFNTPIIKENYKVEGDIMNEAMIEKHDKLNPKLWDENNELRPEVREKINEIVDKFETSLEENDIKLDVEDVCIIGSNASYNYNPTSDVDIHIIADTSVYSDEDLALKTYLAYKSLFNDKYDPTIRGIECEVYVEPHEVHANSKGIYSLEKGWLKEPEATDVPEVDQKEIEVLAQDFIDRAEDLSVGGSAEDVDNLIDDIYLQRQQSIMKDGEFAKGNLVFKLLRSLGIIKDLRDRKVELENQEMSIEEKLSMEGIKDSLRDLFIEDDAEEVIDESIKADDIFKGERFKDSDSTIEILANNGDTVTYAVHYQNGRSYTGIDPIGILLSMMNEFGYKNFESKKFNEDLDDYAYEEGNGVTVDLPSAKDNLAVYLSWEGIYGYTDDIIQFASAGEGVLRDYLEEEGLFGYANKCMEILDGYPAYCSGMDMSDFKSICRELGIELDQEDDPLAEGKDISKGDRFRNANGAIIEITEPTKDGRPQFAIIDGRDGKEEILSYRTTSDSKTLAKILDVNGYKRIEESKLNEGLTSNDITLEQIEQFPVGTVLGIDTLDDPSDPVFDLRDNYFEYRRLEDGWHVFVDGNDWFDGDTFDDYDVFLALTNLNTPKVYSIDIKEDLDDKRPVDAYLNVTYEDYESWGYPTEDEFVADVLDYNGKHCVAYKSVYVETGDPKDDYYDITFDDGHELSGVSGYDLEFEDNNNINEAKKVALTRASKDELVKAIAVKEYEDDHSTSMDAIYNYAYEHGPEFVKKDLERAKEEAYKFIEKYFKIYNYNESLKDPYVEKSEAQLKKMLKNASEDEAKKIKAELNARGIYLKGKGPKKVNEATYPWEQDLLKVTPEQGLRICDELGWGAAVDYEYGTIYADAKTIQQIKDEYLDKYGVELSESLNEGTRTGKDLIFDRDTGSRDVQYGINKIAFYTDNYDDAVRWNRQLDAAIEGDLDPITKEPSDDPKYFDPEDYPGVIQEIPEDSRVNPEHKYAFWRDKDILLNLPDTKFVDGKDDDWFNHDLDIWATPAPPGESKATSYPYTFTEIPESIENPNYMERRMMTRDMLPEFRVKRKGSKNAWIIQSGHYRTLDDIKKDYKEDRYEVSVVNESVDDLTDIERAAWKDAMALDKPSGEELEDYARKYGLSFTQASKVIGLIHAGLDFVKYFREDDPEHEASIDYNDLDEDVRVSNAVYSLSFDNREDLDKAAEVLKKQKFYVKVSDANSKYLEVYCGEPDRQQVNDILNELNIKFINESLNEAWSSPADYANYFHDHPTLESRIHKLVVELDHHDEEFFRKVLDTLDDYNDEDYDESLKEGYNRLLKKFDKADEAKRFVKFLDPDLEPRMETADTEDENGNVITWYEVSYWDPVDYHEDELDEDKNKLTSTCRSLLKRSSERSRDKSPEGIYNHALKVAGRSEYPYVKNDLEKCKDAAIEFIKERINVNEAVDEFNSGSNKNIEVDSEPYKRLNDLCNALNAMNLVDKWNGKNVWFDIKETYENFGEGMKWKTIICYDGNGGHHQILSPRAWMDIANGKVSTEEAIDRLLAGEYCQFKKLENTEESLTEDVDDLGRAKLLANHLDIDVDDIDQFSDYEFDTPEGDYYVVTEDEAYDLAKDDIKNLFDDIGFNSFTPKFQKWILDNAIDQDAINEFVSNEIDYFTNDEPDANMVDYLKGLTDKQQYVVDTLGADTFKDFAKDHVDLDKVAEEAISEDGVANFIAAYDGDEVDLGGGYFAYRLN